MIKFDFDSYMKNGINFKEYDDRITDIKKKLSSDNLLNGWYDVDKCISRKEIKEITNISKYIKNNCDVFIIIGIGGSYLGSKAVIDALSPYYSKKRVEIIYAGTSLSSSYLNDLMNYIKNKEIIINIISKSGSTLEPLIAYDVIFEHMCSKYSEEELSKRIIVTTDNNDGYLRKLAVENKYTLLTIPQNIGGRYSVLTVCGLLPIAVAGFDINRILEGAKKCDIKEAFNYAVIRNNLYNNGKIIESFTIYEPKLRYFTEWLKQLFAESEGKDEKGILPVSSINTMDLHSLGQFFQQGSRIIFETVISILKTDSLYIKKYNKSLDEINSIAAHKVAEAHFKSTTYSNFIEMEKSDEFHMGYLIYFFEVSAAASAYLISVNPFDQPGVNEYKDLINNELNR